MRPAPFVAQSDLDLFGDTDAVPVANPLRAEEGFLRTRLTPGLLRTVARNVARGVRQIAIFEVGTTFRLGDPFVEQRKLGFAFHDEAELVEAIRVNRGLSYGVRSRFSMSRAGGVFLTR